MDNSIALLECFVVLSKLLDYTMIMLSFTYNKRFDLLVTLSQGYTSSTTEIYKADKMGDRVEL